MKPLAIHRPETSRVTLWIFLALVELILACANILFPYYIIPVFLGLLLLLAIYFCPELAYFLFILSLGNHLLHLQIDFVHSVPPRLERLAEIPVDIVVLRTPVMNLLALITLLIWGFARMAKARPPYPKTTLDLPMGVFFAWFVISLFWTPDWVSGLFVVFGLFCCYLGYFLSVSMIRTRKILHITIWLFIVLGLVNSVVTAYSLHGEPAWKEIYRSENISFYFTFIHMAGKRGMGLIFSPMTAYFLNIPIMLAVAMFLITKSLVQKLTLASMILFMLYALLATLPKGGLLGVFTGSSFIVLTYKPLRRHWFALFAVWVVSLVIVAILVYFSWPWPERGQLFLPRESSLPRWFIWQNGFEDLMKSYGFGYGCGAFYPAHSIYLGVLFELGFPGFVIFMWLLFRLFCAIRSSLLIKSIDLYFYKMILGFAAAMISVLTVGLADSYYYEENLWILLGVGMAIINLVHKSSSEKAHTSEVP